MNFRSIQLLFCCRIVLNNNPGVPYRPKSKHNTAWKKIKAGMPPRMATRLSLIRSVAFRPCFTTGLALSLCELLSIKKRAIRFAALADIVLAYGVGNPFKKSRHNGPKDQTFNPQMSQIAQIALISVKAMRNL